MVSISFQDWYKKEVDKHFCRISLKYTYLNEEIFKKLIEEVFGKVNTNLEPELMYWHTLCYVKKGLTYVEYILLYQGIEDKKVRDQELIERLINDACIRFYEFRDVKLERFNGLTPFYYVIREDIKNPVSFLYFASGSAMRYFFEQQIHRESRERGYIQEERELKRTSKEEQSIQLRIYNVTKEVRKILREGKKENKYKKFKSYKWGFANWPERYADLDNPERLKKPFGIKGLPVEKQIDIILKEMQCPLPVILITEIILREERALIHSSQFKPVENKEDEETRVEELIGIEEGLIPEPKPQEDPYKRVIYVKLAQDTFNSFDHSMKKILGLGWGQRLSNEKIARKLGISRENVRQKKREVISKIWETIVFSKLTQPQEEIFLDKLREIAEIYYSNQKGAKDDKM